MKTSHRRLSNVPKGGIFKSICISISQRIYKIDLIFERFKKRQDSSSTRGHNSSLRVKFLRWNIVRGPESTNSTNDGGIRKIDKCVFVDIQGVDLVRAHAGKGASSDTKGFRL